jgi:hypothetical protein
MFNKLHMQPGNYRYNKLKYNQTFETCNPYSLTPYKILYVFYQTKICVKIFGIENVYNSAIEIIYIIYIISMNSAHTL